MPRKRLSAVEVVEAHIARIEIDAMLRELGEASGATVLGGVRATGPPFSGGARRTRSGAAASC